MENVKKIPKKFFEKDRSCVQPEKTEIYPIKWDKKVLSGQLKDKVIVKKAKKK